LIESALPTSVQSMIERKIDLVSEEDRRLLGAAAVQGWEFDSALLAAVLAIPPEHIEERLAALDNMQALVRPLGERELPDGAINIRYRFVHTLYQEAFARQLTASRRVRLSLEVGQALERAYGSDSRAVISKLAYLFEQARDFERAT